MCQCEKEYASGSTDMQWYNALLLKKHMTSSSILGFIASFEMHTE